MRKRCPNALQVSAMDQLKIALTLPLARKSLEEIFDLKLEHFFFAVASVGIPGPIQRGGLGRGEATSEGPKTTPEAEADNISSRRSNSGAAGTAVGSGEGEAVATWPLAAAAALGAEAAAAALGAAAAAVEGVTGEAAVLVEGTQPLRKLLLRRRTCWQAAVAAVVAALETAELGQVRVSYQLSLKRLILSKEKASLELRFLPTIFMDS